MLPACETILNAIGNLLTDRCQVEEFLFAEDIFGFFGKLPIHRRLVPKVKLNGEENIWQFMRQNWLSNRAFKSFDAAPVAMSLARHRN
jgi:hypothetical protein